MSTVWVISKLSVVCHFYDINGSTLLKYPPEYTAYFFEPPCICLCVCISTLKQAATTNKHSPEGASMAVILQSLIYSATDMHVPAVLLVNFLSHLA